MAYVHLHGYSTYSFLEGDWKPKDHCADRKRSLTECDCIDRYGGDVWSNFALQGGEELDINAIIGVELGFVLDIQSAKKQRNLNYDLVIQWILKDIKNLLNLTTFAGQQGVERFPKIDLATLKRFNTQLIALI